MNKYSEYEIKEALKKLDYWYNKEEAKNYGLNEHFEENGTNLSITQKSLINVTKLLLKKDCRIIILDDLCSCIDDEITLESVYKAIYSTFPFSTIIILTHEIKNYMEIDKIMTINNGIIEEFDTYDNLFNNKRSLFNSLQNNYFEDEND